MCTNLLQYKQNTLFLKRETVLTLTVRRWIAYILAKKLKPYTMIADTQFQITFNEYIMADFCHRHPRTKCANDAVQLSCNRNENNDL